MMDKKAFFLVFGGAIVSILVMLFAAVFLSGCATVPYSASLRPLADNPPPWLTDGPDSQITVYNRTDTRARLTVECAGAPQDWVVEVDPHSQVSAFGQLMAINTRGDACRVTRVETPTPRGWEEIVMPAAAPAKMVRR